MHMERWCSVKSLAGFKVEARKLEHVYPHALEAKHRDPMFPLSGVHFFDLDRQFRDLLSSTRVICLRLYGCTDFGTNCSSLYVRQFSDPTSSGMGPANWKLKARDTADPGIEAIPNGTSQRIRRIWGAQT